MSPVAKIAIGLVCFLGFILATLLFFYAGNPWIEEREIPIFGSRFLDSTLFGLAGLFCVFVNIRLMQGKAWAWWTALAASVLILHLEFLSSSPLFTLATILLDQKADLDWALPSS